MVKKEPEVSRGGIRKKSECVTKNVAYYVLIRHIMVGEKVKII